MKADTATDAQRATSERTTSVCPECDAPPGNAHAPDCVLRPALRYQDYLRERYARRDPVVYRIGGEFVPRPEFLETV